MTVSRDDLLRRHAELLAKAKVASSNLERHGYEALARAFMEVAESLDGAFGCEPRRQSPNP